MRKFYPIGVLIIAMVCFQIGAALAKGLFPIIGAAGGTALRLGFAAIVLAVVFRPWRLRPTKSQARVIVLYGLAMGCMNFFFYQSLRSIPLGLTVALEFTGPLSVALAASRRPLDFAWILMAAAGIWELFAAALWCCAIARIGCFVWSRGGALAGHSTSCLVEKPAVRTAAQTTALGTLGCSRRIGARRNCAKRHDVADTCAAADRFCGGDAVERNTLFARNVRNAAAACAHAGRAG